MKNIQTRNKLVRDEIPSSLMEKGILSHIHIVGSKQDLFSLLIAKGHEEGSEIKKAVDNRKNKDDTKDIIEETADLYEVRRGMSSIYKKHDRNKNITGQIKTVKNIVISTLKKYNISPKSIIATANEKRKQKGGFFKGVFLHNTIENI